MKKTILGLLPVIAITIVLFYNPVSTSNKRTNPNSENEETMNDFESRIENADETNLPTRSEKLTELETQAIQPPTVVGGDSVKEGDSITVHYRGWFASTGEVFDKSFNHSPDGFTFTVGSGVIEGWSEGVIGMQVGEVKRLLIPSDKAYGPDDYSDIPGGSDLIFDVELISIN